MGVTPFEVKHGDRTVVLSHPTEPGPGQSFFAFGVPKGGSTLLSKVMVALCKATDMPVVRPLPELHRAGIEMAQLGPDMHGFFQSHGFGYIGFRGIPVDALPRFAFRRSVALVRDPRDMIVSRYFSEAISHRPPPDAAGEAARAKFEARRQSAQGTNIDIWVRQNLRGERTNLASVRRAQRIGTMRIWRYEDIIFDKANWIAQMADHLGLNISPEKAAQIAAKMEPAPDVEKPDAHVRKVTPGDHLEKLLPGTIDILNTRFAEDLAHFGYPADARVSAKAG